MEFMEFQASNFEVDIYCIGTVYRGYLKNIFFTALADGFNSRPLRRKKPFQDIPCITHYKYISIYFRYRYTQIYRRDNMHR